MKDTFRKEDVKTVILSVEQKSLLIAILERYGELEYTSDGQQYYFFCDKFIICDLYPLKERKIHISPIVSTKAETIEKALVIFLNDILFKERENNTIYFNETKIRVIPIIRENVEKFVTLSTQVYTFSIIEKNDVDMICQYKKSKETEIIKHVIEKTKSF